jgi:prepilin-type N-terminal cleavage/methylation domain-containing protein
MKSLRKACRGQKGFTLIELLVVIIILGVLAAVVTLAVTRFIGKGTLESANAELVTVQAAVEAALAEGNSASFDGVANYAWTGDLGTSPIIASENVTAYAQMRTHKFKATYTITPGGDVIGGNADGGSASSGWGETKISWCDVSDEWVKEGGVCP